MAVVLVPTYPIAGLPVLLTLTATSGSTAAYAISTRPVASTLKLGVLTKGREHDEVRVEATATVSFVDDDPGIITRTLGSFVADGFEAGQSLIVRGSTLNNGQHPIAAVTATTITLIAGDRLTSEGPVSVTLQGIDPAEHVEAALLAALEDTIEDTIIFDVAGEYTILGFDLREVVAVPAFPDDPSGARRFILLATQSTIVHVGALLDLPVVTDTGHGATLRLQVNHETIRAAELREHRDTLSRTAALATTVTASVAAFVGAAPLTAVGTFQTRVNDLRTNVAAHFSTAGPFHSVADTVNAITRYQSGTQETAIELLNYLRDKLRSHLRLLTTGIRAHTNDDEASLPLVGAASTLGEAQVLLSDLRERVYERHRVLGTGATPPIHINVGGDATNALSASKGTPTLTFADANPDTITRSVGSWISDGFWPGQSVTVAGSALNDGTYAVATVTATVLTLGAAATLVAEVLVAAPPGTVTGTTTLLDDLIVAYLDAIAAADPSVVPGEPEGSLDLQHMAGFIPAA